MGEVIFHGFLGDVEAPGNFLIAFAGQQQLQHVPFPQTQFRGHQVRRNLFLGDRFGDKLGRGKTPQRESQILSSPDRQLLYHPYHNP
jgi:hypothetical protein